MKSNRTKFVQYSCVCFFQIFILFAHQMQFFMISAKLLPFWATCVPRDKSCVGHEVCLGVHSSPLDTPHVLLAWDTQVSRSSRPVCPMDFPVPRSSGQGSQGVGKPPVSLSPSLSASMQCLQSQPNHSSLCKQSSSWLCCSFTALHGGYEGRASGNRRFPAWSFAPRGWKPTNRQQNSQSRQFCYFRGLLK